MKNYCFVVNPASRGGKSKKFLSGLKKWVEKKLPDSRWTLTEGPGHASQLASAAAEAGYGRVISVGGDGTLHEVVNGLALLPKKRRPQVGTISSGTGGDFSRMMKERFVFPNDWEWLRAPAAWPVDLGRVDFEDAGGNRMSRVFINIADVGISGEVTRRVNATRRTLGTLEYLKATLAAAWSYRPPRVRLSAPNLRGDTFPEKMRLLLLVVANGRYFGGGMCIAPSARPDDRLFSVMVAENVNYLTLVTRLPNIYLKKKLRHPHIYHSEGTELQIESLESELPMGMDGEFLLVRRAGFAILPQAVEILVPSG